MDESFIFVLFGVNFSLFFCFCVVKVLKYLNLKNIVTKGINNYIYFKNILNLGNICFMFIISIIFISANKGLFIENRSSYIFSCMKKYD